MTTNSKKVLTMRTRLRTFTLMASASVLLGCAYATVQPRQSIDNAAFTAAVERFRGDAEGELRVDPRSVRFGSDLGSLDRADLAPTANATVQERTRELRHLGIRATDIFHEQRCLYSVGAPPANESAGERAHREACIARGPFTALIVSNPSPAGEVDGAPTWMVSVARMTTSSHQAWELRLRRGPGNTFTVISEDRKHSIMS